VRDLNVEGLRQRRGMMAACLKAAEPGLLALYLKPPILLHARA
jgi:hypothetical protein